MTAKSPQVKPEENSGAKLPALLNGLAVLRAFTHADPVLGVTEIAGRVGLHKSSVSRILATLESVDLVERDNTNRFRLGLGVLDLAGPLLADLDVRRVAYPQLKALTEQTGETSALMVWNGEGAVCVEQVPSPHEIKHSTPIGWRYTTDKSACVQVFLAHQDAAFEAVREAGVAVNYAQSSPDEVGVAAPVFDHRGDLVAVVLLSAPKFRVSEDDLDALVKHVRATAEAVTARLAGAPG